MVENRWTIECSVPCNGFTGNCIGSSDSCSAERNVTIRRFTSGMPAVPLRLFSVAPEGPPHPDYASETFLSSALHYLRQQHNSQYSFRVYRSVRDRTLANAVENLHSFGRVARQRFQEATMRVDILSRNLQKKKGFPCLISLPCHHRLLLFCSGNRHGKGAANRLGDNNSQSSVQKLFPVVFMFTVF